jgi:hypothetical protein
MNKWFEMFENGRTSVTDTERSGHPAAAVHQWLRAQPKTFFF